jgi:hypothetical protein
VRGWQVTSRGSSLTKFLPMLHLGSVNLENLDLVCSHHTITDLESHRADSRSTLWEANSSLIKFPFGVLMLEDHVKVSNPKLLLAEYGRTFTLGIHWPYLGRNQTVVQSPRSSTGIDRADIDPPFSTTRIHWGRKGQNLTTTLTPANENAIGTRLSHLNIPPG